MEKTRLRLSQFGGHHGATPALLLLVSVSLLPLPHWPACSPPSSLLGDTLGFSVVASRSSVPTAWPVRSPLDVLIRHIGPRVAVSKRRPDSTPPPPAPVCGGRAPRRQQPPAPNTCPLVSPVGPCLLSLARSSSPPASPPPPLVLRSPSLVVPKELREPQS